MSILRSMSTGGRAARKGTIAEVKIEKNKKYDEMNIVDVINNITNFSSSIWQIHPFREGNTRTIALFIEKYLVSLGYAKVAYLYGDYKYTEDLKKEESIAKSKKLGVWSLEEETTTKKTEKTTKKVTESETDDSIINDLLKDIRKMFKNLFKSIFNKIKKSISKQLDNIFS